MAALFIDILEAYEQISYLGKGDSGAVVLARHRATGKTVAIKLLGDKPGQQAVVLREASFFQACGDIPYVVHFSSLVRQPGSMELISLVMDYVGPSLRNLLLLPVPEDCVRNIMWQLLSGAEEMHRCHIIHRDTKPENVLLDEFQNTFKICDLGLALSMSSDEQSYDQVGTLWYMAPEMLLGKPDYNAGIDNWSLGCVMAELLSGGRVLFPGRNNSAASQLHAIIDLLGVPNASAWPWFYSTPFAAGVLTETQDNMLHERFPMLSLLGFEVLSGLLTWNPDKRLTASAALQHPWVFLHRPWHRRRSRGMLLQTCRSCNTPSLWSISLDV